MLPRTQLGLPAVEDIAASDILYQSAGRKILFRRLDVSDFGDIGFANVEVQRGD